MTRQRNFSPPRSMRCLRCVWHRIVRDRQGVSAVTFALAAPVILMLIFGAFSVGMLLFADGVLRHAVGEGARFAQASRAADQTAIERRIRENLLGLDPAGIRQIAVATGSHTSETDYATVTMQYELDYSIPFVPSRMVELEVQRTVYWADYT